MSPKEIAPAPGNDEPPPLISCVMPTYGRPLYVNEAVAMFLEQDYPAKELIILNDCPGQIFTCDLPEVHVINASERYPTLGEKRNACIDLARGEIIAVWDDDDVYLPWQLSLSQQEMRRFDTPFYRPAKFWTYWGEDHLREDQMAPGWVSHPTTLFKKDLWEKVEGYPAMDSGEDGQFFHRIHEYCGKDFIKYEIGQEDTSFILRGKSHYQHMSISGGEQPLDTKPGTYPVEPTEIQDPCLRRHYVQLIRNHNNRPSE